MMKFLRNIKTRFRRARLAFRYPDDAVVVKVQRLTEDGIETLRGKDAMAYMTEQVSRLSDIAEELDVQIKTAFVAGYKNGVEDWAKDQHLPDNRADQYLTRNVDYLRERFNCN